MGFARHTTRALWFVDNWMGIAKRFSESYRVILPDHEPWTKSTFQQSYIPGYGTRPGELVDNLGIDNFHLLGHSMGGRTAMLYQSRFPTG
jgi:pimeloyl-ACP methyl ester carboxylesterase